MPRFTAPQCTALLAAANLVPEAAAYVTGGNDSQLADWFNKPHTKTVWRLTLTPEMARAAIVKGAAQLDALTVGKRDTLLYLAQGNLDVSDPNVRAAIDDLCGSQATLKAAFVDAEKRIATIAEAALATGTGTVAVPAYLAWEGQINQGDISGMRGA